MRQRNQDRENKDLFKLKYTLSGKSRQAQVNSCPEFFGKPGMLDIIFTGFGVMFSDFIAAPSSWREGLCPYLALIRNVMASVQDGHLSARLILL